MNFDRVYDIAFAVALAAASLGQLDRLQSWVWKAQARVAYESRPATWGSPRFFPTFTSKSGDASECQFGN